MNNAEMVQTLMDTIQRGNLEHAKTMSAAVFQFSRPVRELMDADAWLGMSTGSKTAFPGLNYHFKVLGADGGVVRSTFVFFFS